MLWAEGFALLIGPGKMAGPLVFIPGRTGQIYRLLAQYGDPTPIAFVVQSDI